jgi:hypothetical protein
MGISDLEGPGHLTCDADEVVDEIRLVFCISMLKFGLAFSNCELRALTPWPDRRA